MHTVLKFGAALAAAQLFSTAAGASTLDFVDFSDTSGLQLNGTAHSTWDGTRDVLRITNATNSQAGSVFSTTPITFGSQYSFSTQFTFNFNTQGGGGADGLVFVIQPNSNTAGSAGGGIGYQGIGNSLGIEFDNWDNGAGDNYSNNHIGIDFNGSVNSVLLTAAPFPLDSGQDLTAWIDYNGATNLLEVRFNDSTARPTSPLLSYVVDLASIIGNQNAFVGFTSATGGAYANHDVVSWEFRETYAPLGGVPEGSTWALLIVGFGAIGATMRRRQSVTVRAFA